MGESVLEWVTNKRMISREGALRRSRKRRDGFTREARSFAMTKIIRGAQPVTRAADIAGVTAAPVHQNRARSTLAGAYICIGLMSWKRLPSGSDRVAIQPPPIS
jgi:hypothetical protein